MCIDTVPGSAHDGANMNTLLCSMWRRVIAVLPPLLVIECLGCRHDPPQYKYDTLNANIPVIAVFRYPGNVDLEDNIGGLVGVVWQNGRIMRATTENMIGVSYIEWQLSDAQVAELSKLIVALNLKRLANTEQNLLVDAASQTVYAHDNTGTVEFSESLRYPQGATLRITNWMFLQNPDDHKTVESVPPGEWKAYANSEE